MHVIKCKGQASQYRIYFSAFSSTGKYGSLLRLWLILPCHMIVQNDD